jgi:hypothetical protein
VPDPKNPGKFIYRGGSAMGKYQFIPGTLKDQAQKLYGEGWQNHLFDNQAQEDLNLSFLGDNAKRLKAAGLPVTDASLYMMHFFGNPRQTGMVLNGKDDTRMSEILGDFASKQNPGIATMTVADYKNHLRKKGFDFQSVDVVTPTVAPKTTGDALDNGSKTLRDAKNDSKRSGDVTILNKNTTIRKGSNIYESPDENTYASPILHEQYGY